MKKRRIGELLTVAAVVAVVVWFGHRPGRIDTQEPQNLESTGTPVAVETRQVSDHEAGNHKTWVESHPVQYEDRKEDLRVRKEDQSHFLRGSFPASAPDRLKTGEELFAANCASCHGEKALGDGPAGALLDPPPANLTDPTNYHYGRGAVSILLSTAYGNSGTGMAPWDGILSRDEMIDISLYVESIVKK